MKGHFMGVQRNVIVSSIESTGKNFVKNAYVWQFYRTDMQKFETAYKNINHYINCGDG